MVTRINEGSRGILPGLASPSTVACRYIAHVLAQFLYSTTMITAACLSRHAVYGEHSDADCPPDDDRRNDGSPFGLADAYQWNGLSAMGKLQGRGSENRDHNEQRQHVPGCAARLADKG
ncbi:hypothetical protein [Nonomuraea sp. NPDC049480]|uniref:hypothetical protein n=1 Tax=Nonomuraea sp. NPDC049480 TaxID=3364353 RepID=UPI0037BB2B07